MVHFENNSPFLSVSPLVRHIEVSHWGNIAVEETLDIYHTGAKLKGSFSRFEYQRESSGVSSVKSFKVIYDSCITKLSPFLNSQCLGNRRSCQSWLRMSITVMKLETFPHPTCAPRTTKWCWNSVRVSPFLADGRPIT